MGAPAAEPASAAAAAAAADPGAGDPPQQAGNGLASTRAGKQSSSHHAVNVLAGDSVAVAASGEHVAIGSKAVGGSRRTTALAAKLAALAVLWYGATLAGTVVNKTLMDGMGSAALLSFAHVFTGGLMDAAFLRGRGLEIPVKRSLMWRAAPVAAALAAAKLLTYVSYANVPASLTHTVKASSPIFSVAMSWVMFAQLPGAWTCLSLVPITAGVTLAAVSEVDFHLVGFLAAITASMLGVAQSAFTKRTLVQVRVHPVAFHMYTCLAAQVVLLPGFLHAISGAFFAGGNGELDVAEAQSPEAAAAAAAVPFPWAMLLASVTLHYLQNLAAIYVLSHVNFLTYQVMGTLKRLVTIVGSVMFFGTVVSLQNAGGVTLALVGFLSYGLSRARSLPPEVKRTPVLGPTPVQPQGSVVVQIQLSDVRKEHQV